MFYDSLTFYFKILSILFLSSQIKVGNSSVAPILDIEDEATGYLGTINERSVLVDLKPHLQIKNIESINGICSYHVFKPNTEEFPFTIDIKDKKTGEAVIELVRKELEDTHLSNIQRSILIDCTKKKEFDFLIQAHDCSSPSIASNKIPVKILVNDHDDYKLQFEEQVYKKILVESESLYENFMKVTAKDQDCTNDGFACSYKIVGIDTNDISADFPFRINNNGMLSSVRAVKSREMFKFKVRAFDCVSRDSFVETDVVVDIIESCKPQWIDYSNKIVSSIDNVNAFDSIKLTSCEQFNKNANLNDDSMCEIEGVNTHVSLELDQNLIDRCKDKKCPDSQQTKQSRIVLFNGQESKVQYQDDDSIEDEYDSAEDDENNVVKVDAEQSKSQNEPLNYRSFSKVIENAQKVEFDGSFGSEFTLTAWLRRPSNADRNVKEQVFCGSDSNMMNRHHFGLYFYHGSLKFLLRREPSTKGEQANKNEEISEIFYPSLWEWSLSESLLTDSKWHQYEIRFSYPNAYLYIDGVKFAENTTNTDIVDAYELSEVGQSGPISVYIGACYHARTKSLIDHFEGDIGSVILVKKPIEQENTVLCKQGCNEYIELNMVGNENYLQAIQSSSLNEISIHTANSNDMVQLLRKLTYVNKDTYPLTGSRSLKVETTIKCKNSGKETKLSPIMIDLQVNRQKQEYNIELEGSKQLSFFRFELENGVEPFKDIEINQIPINKIDSTKIEDESLIVQDNGETKLAKCQIKISPQRNLMAPQLNDEKVMFLQNLLDEFGFKFEETLDSVTISGVQEAENYETFIRRLTYVITNINEVESASLAYVKSKKFYISCFRNEPSIETNTVLVQLNVTENQEKKEPVFIAHKQLNRFVVSEEEDDILSKRIDQSSSGKQFTKPLMIALVAMSVCSVAFLLVFAALRLYASRNKRRPLANEENPQMEWDDSGLNIIENPLENIQIEKEYPQNVIADDDEYSSNEEDGDEVSQDGENALDSDSEDGEENDRYKIIDRELEWDDTSIELKLKGKSSKNSSSNKILDNYMVTNKFV